MTNHSNAGPFAERPLETAGHQSIRMFGEFLQGCNWIGPCSEPIHASTKDKIVTGNREGVCRLVVATAHGAYHHNVVLLVAIEGVGEQWNSNRPIA